MRSAQMNVSDREFAAPLLAIYASTFKVRDNIADLEEQGRWVMFASVANIFATGLLAIVLVLEM